MDLAKNILVPNDYSPCADHALRYAAQLARQVGAHLVVLHVVPLQPPSLEAGIWTPDEVTRRQETDRLTQHVAALLDGDGSRCELAVVWGDPTQQIVEAARVHASDLIVMGTHGRSGVKRFMIGSVAERVVRYAPCPVLTLRQADQRPPQPAALAAGKGPTVDSVMQCAPATIGPGDTLAAAQTVMEREGVRQLPVVEAGTLIGMLSDRDLHQHIGYFERTKVDAAMTRDPITVTATESAPRVARLLIEKHINALPVVEDGRVIGIVSKTDLLRLLLRLIEGEQP